jgi:hypothetical protein
MDAITRSEAAPGAHSAEGTDEFEPGTAQLPVSGRYTPKEYFPEAATWTEAELRDHLEYAAAYERRTGYPYPRPWRSPEDRQGWRVVARGRGVGAPRPLIRVEVDLDRAQSEWVAAAAARAGVDYSTYIKTLVDADRAAAAPDTGSRTPPEAPAHWSTAEPGRRRDDLVNGADG